MTPDPITVGPSTDLQDAIRLLADHRISGLPVIDEQKQLVGVISDTDLMWQESGVDAPPYIMLLDSIIYLQNPARHEKEIHKALGQTVGEVMNNIPKNRILIETDAPDLLPHGLDSRLNEPANLLHVLNRASELMNLSSAMLAEQTYINACRFFNIEN